MTARVVNDAAKIAAVNKETNFLFIGEIIRTHLADLYERTSVIATVNPRDSNSTKGSGLAVFAQPLVCLGPRNHSI